MRGTYFHRNKFDAITHPAVRLVIDMGDPDEILGIVAGGASGRRFSPHLRDHIRPWLDGELASMWFTPELAEQYAESILTLKSR